jgi:hypothetical protein
MDQSAKSVSRLVIISCVKNGLHSLHGLHLGRVWRNDATNLRRYGRWASGTNGTLFLPT